MQRFMTTKSLPHRINRVQKASPMSDPDRQHCGLLRRLGAMFYDGLLLFGVLYFASALAVLARGGEAIPPHQPWFGAYLGAVTYIYFAWQWVRGGQTLGMKTWRIRLTGINGAPVGWRAATARFVAALLSWAPCGLGFLWSVFDGQHMAWHDRLSRTILVRR